MLLPYSAGFFVPLVIAWFLLYWILGGVLFSIIAFVFVHRIRRARFGCLFSFATIGVAVIAAWTGMAFAAHDLQSCELSASVTATAALETWIQQFACGIIPLTLAFLIGFVPLLILGLIFLSLSRRTDLSWIERGHAKGEGE